MPAVTNTSQKPVVLSSLWDGLSPHLIAQIWQVDKTGKRDQNADNITVKCAIVDGNLDIALNWQSPFDTAGVESKAPMLAAMLQSGALQPVVDAVNSKVSGLVDTGNAQKNASNFLQKFEGRTGITKLNSTQVFSGTPGAKIQITALFRAWRNPKDEVETPFNQLMYWALPKRLAESSTFLSRLINGSLSVESAVDILLPSESPAMVAIKYKNRTYTPLVIESIGLPINSPIDKNGDFVELSVPLSLTTLTAIGRDDWKGYSEKK